MKNYLIRKYALSDDGAKDMIKAIRWSILVNLFYVLPGVLSIYILNSVINNSKNPNVLIIVGISIAIVIVLFLLETNRYDLAYTKTYDESAKNRINLAEKLRKLPLAYFGKRDLGDLTSTIMLDVTELENIYSHAISNLYASLITSTLFSVLLLIYSWKLSLALMWVIPLAFLILLVSSIKIRSEFKNVHSSKLKLTSCFQEGLDSISEIKAYNYERDYSNELNSLLDRYEKMLIKEEAVTGVFFNLSISLLKLGLVSFVIIGAMLLSKGEIDLFTYIAFIVISPNIFIPYMQSFANITLLTYADVRIERLKEMNEMPIQGGGTEFSPETYDITFEDVKFSYDEGVSVINGISFEAKQNQVTALVGPSGGGKSTTAKLAARFWDIQEGKIKLGGQDISKIDPETLLKHYSIVFQDVTLFNFSVLENIRVGKKDATDEEVLRVAKLAQCDDIAEKLADGYYTLVGENGEKLSGGERQRISIARAMLKDAPVIILDEATASIDAENESKIQRALSELVRGKTVLVIAHRMRTVRNADKVVVLKDGKIIEEGDPDDLIKKGGLFADMNRAQTANL